MTKIDESTIDLLRKLRKEKEEECKKAAELCGYLTAVAESMGTRYKDELALKLARLHQQAKDNEYKLIDDELYAALDVIAGRC